MSLALKYRPTEFDDVVGQRATSVILKAMIAKGVLAQVLLFTGPSGVGKTTMARIVAAELNFDSKEDVHKGVHPAVLEIDAASNGSVEAIRELKRSLNFAVSGNKVIVIDEAHAMSSEAFAALLNMLEFPPAHVTFILITTESHKIPITIRHRCDRYSFRKASIEDLVQRLSYINSAEDLEVSDELLNLIAQRSEGSYRESVMLLEQVAVAEIKTVTQYNELQGEIDYGPTLIRSTMDGPASAINRLESVLRYTNPEEVSDRTIETLKDLMLIKSGITLSHTSGALNSRIELAAKLGSDQILKAMKIIWDLQTKLTNADPVRGLEMAFSLMGDVFKPVVAEPVAATRTLSFEEMRNRGSK